MLDQHKPRPEVKFSLGVGPTAGRYVKFGGRPRPQERVFGLETQPRELELAVRAPAELVPFQLEEFGDHSVGVHLCKNPQ